MIQRLEVEKLWVSLQMECTSTGYITMICQARQQIVLVLRTSQQLAQATRMGSLKCIWTSWNWRLGFEYENTFSELEERKWKTAKNMLYSFTGSFQLRNLISNVDYVSSIFSKSCMTKARVTKQRVIWESYDYGELCQTTPTFPNDHSQFFNSSNVSLN